MLDGEDKIVEDAIRGEASAFGLLYDHYQPKIYRFVFIKVGRREDAEDLTHQVFINAWQNVRRYQTRGFPFSSWLYQIARNQVIDFYRTRKSQVTLEDVPEGTLAGAANPSLLAEEHMALIEVQQAIRRLKPDYQDVLIMRFVEDLSIRETASALGKSEGAVKLMQHRAIRALRELFPNTETK